VSKDDWLLFLHISGAFLLVGGSVVAAAFTIFARRRERPSEIAELLRLVRIALPLIYGGVLLTLVFGLWLVHDTGYSFGDSWIVAALVLWVVANALGGIGGNRDEKTRKLAERLASEGDVASPELAARLHDPISLALNFGGGLVIVAILALMIWKPS
jgi:uncharacterized membrane protein